MLHRVVCFFDVVFIMACVVLSNREYRRYEMDWKSEMKKNAVVKVIDWQRLRRRG